MQRETVENRENIFGSNEELKELNDDLGYHKSDIRCFYRQGLTPPLVLAHLDVEYLCLAHER